MSPQFWISAHGNYGMFKFRERSSNWQEHRNELQIMGCNTALIQWLLAALITSSGLTNTDVAHAESKNKVKGWVEALIQPISTTWYAGLLINSIKIERESHSPYWKIRLQTFVSVCFLLKSGQDFCSLSLKAVVHPRQGEDLSAMVTSFYLSQREWDKRPKQPKRDVCAWKLDTVNKQDLS